MLFEAALALLAVLQSAGLPAWVIEDDTQFVQDLLQPYLQPVRQPPAAKSAGPDCHLVFNDMLLVPNARTTCASVGLVDAAVVGADDLDGVRLLMRDCHVDIVVAKDTYSCAIYHADEAFVDTVPRHICDSLVDPSIGQLCRLPSAQLKGQHQVVNRQSQINKQSQINSDCPTVHSAVCPCCPGRGTPVVAISLVPYSQARCVCRQLGMELAVLDSFQVDEAGRRLHDCLGAGSVAWVGALDHHHHAPPGQCPAIQEGPYVTHQNRPLYEKTQVLCNQTLPVLCRAPYDMALYDCYRCGFEWSPECRKCAQVRRWRGFGSADPATWEGREVCFDPPGRCCDKSRLVAAQRTSHKEAEAAGEKSHGRLLSLTLETGQHALAGGTRRPPAGGQRRS